MIWNYRVMRAHEKIPNASNSETYYAIYEVYYAEDGSITNWTQDASGSPFGATLEEMSNDLAWIMTALTKPVLDYETGKEVEPAKLLADDLYKMLDERVPLTNDRGSVA